MLTRTLFLTFSVAAHGALLLSPSSFSLQLHQPEEGQGVKIQLVRAQAPEMPKEQVIESAPVEKRVHPEQKVIAKQVIQKPVPVPAKPKLEQPKPEKRLVAKPKPRKKPLVAISSDRTAKQAVNARPKAEQQPALSLPAVPPEQVLAASTASENEPVSVSRTPAVSTSHDAPSLSPKMLIDLELAYKEALLKLIEANKKYPLRARRRGQEGVVLVSFVVQKDGSITSINIADPSHYKPLNSAATRLVEKIGHFKPIPGPLNKEEWPFQVPIRYALR